MTVDGETILQKVALAFEARADSVGAIGQHRSNMALDFFAGAAFALRASGQSDVADTVGNFTARQIVPFGHEAVKAALGLPISSPIINGITHPLH